MDNVMNVVKIVGILAALIALRFAVQAVIRREGSMRSLRAIMPFAVPPLITGGPGFLGVAALVCVASDPSLPPQLGLMGMLGGVGLALGLVAMFSMLMRQQRELARLGELLAGEEGEGAIEESERQ